MPKQGPSEGSRRQIIAFLPIRLRPSPRPTVVVVLPSPAGVGEIAVTRMSLPFLFFFRDSGSAQLSLALLSPTFIWDSAGVPGFSPALVLGCRFALGAVF